MRVTLYPEAEHAVVEAVREAIRSAGVEASADPNPSRSAWREAALAIDTGDDASPGYPPAPRSSRGATRA